MAPERGLFIWRNRMSDTFKIEYTGHEASARTLVLKKSWRLPKSWPQCANMKLKK